MKIMIFTEGTILMHRNAVGYSREEIVRQVKNGEPSVDDFASYVPIGDAAAKIASWKSQGAEIIYLTSRKETEEVGQIRVVLHRHGYPEGVLLFRQGDESNSKN